MLEHVKTIMIGLTAVRDATEPVAALPYGLSLAAAAGAHADIRSAAIKLILPSGYIYDAGADLLASENARLGEVAAKLADDARREAARAGVSAEVQSTALLYDDVAEDFVAHARVADIAVVDASNGILEIDRGIVEELLFKSGGPVIVVPSSRQAFSARRCVIAWDGGARAARAVKDALPLLHASEDVRIVTVGDRKPASLPGADIAAMLARHRLPVTLVELPESEEGTGEIISRYAVREGADLLVMGAYAHPRFWEMVLGGVTQTMLKTCPVPLLMSY